MPLSNRSPDMAPVSYTHLHEAGHAVASFFLPGHDEVHQISIIPAGRAGGYTLYLPKEDRDYMSKGDMENELVSLLGGRVRCV